MIEQQADPPGRAHVFMYRKDKKSFLEDLPKVLALIAQGKIEPVVAAVFPLRDAGQALELLATGTVEGKIVLTCDQGASFV